MRPAMGCALILATLSSTTACKTMRPVTLEYLRSAQPSRVWVTRADQSVVIVSGPQVLGDTLVGYVGQTFEEIPAAAVKQVKVRMSAPGKTVALVAGSVIGFAAFAYVLAGTGGGNMPNYCDAPENVGELICQGR